MMKPQANDLGLLCCRGLGGARRTVVRWREWTARDRARLVIAAYESGVVSACDGGLEARGVETGEIVETDHWR
ncbi:hypothetical protein OG749_24830 [Streptomyces nojiriensis]|uniref:hypothetical protein n=1 Tax=Streptomyces nojiriensis TaxID=66374 RepID=UPI002E198863